MRKLPWLQTPKHRLKTESREQVLKVRNSRQWRDKTRPQKLLFEPRCEYCLEKGILTEAVEVDHVTPLEAGGSPFDQDNLKSTCRACHGKKTGEENKERNKLRVRDK